MKRTLSTLLAFLLSAMFPIANMVAAEAVSKTALPSDEAMPWENDSENIYNKIHFYVGDDDYSTIDNAEELSKAVDSINSLKATEVDNLGSRGFDDGESMQLFVQFKSDIRNEPTYVNLLSERNSVNTIEEANEWRSRLNNFSKEYHDNLVSECISDMDFLDESDCTHIDYSPFVFINTTSKNINTTCISELAFSECTENIMIDVPSEYLELATWEDTLDNINATSVVNSSKYTGKGVNIGVLESKGVCDCSNEFLKTKNITVRKSDSAVTTHATEVVSVIASLAPEANYFVDVVPEAGALPFTWFLQNNCQVINMSFEIVHPKVLSEEYVYDEKGDVIGKNTTYDKPEHKYMLHIDGLVDYMIYNHEISVVVSSGNIINDNSLGNYNPDGEITSPGYAYNAITVGGVYYNETSKTVQHYKKACCVSNEGMMKPNLSAIANGLVLPSDENNVLSGTSFSAPQVTAAIALLIEKKPIYGVFTSRPFAMLMASAEKVLAYDSNDYNQNGYFDVKVGAGILNIEALLMDTDVRYFENINNENGSVIGQQKIQLNEGDEIQIAIVWTPVAKYSYPYYDANEGVQYNGYTPFVSNYTLTLSEAFEDENTVAYSALENSNVELIRYTAQCDGEYDITVLLSSDMPDSIECDAISLAYMIK